MPKRPADAARDPRGPTPKPTCSTILAPLAPAFAAILATSTAGASVPDDDPGTCPPGSDTIRRVVSLLPSATEVLAAMGAGQRVVGRSRFDRAPEVAGARSVGGVVAPSLEEILALEPDLVITWRGVTDPAASRRLEASDVRVFPAWMESVDDVVDTARRLGSALCLEERGDSLARSIR
ncbi:MAG TPA: helical backbone metal receptor, partial [Longimicrobiales bacterium]|nr:helical backbone metal receptor [Longimicrobiales bacterium]